MQSLRKEQKELKEIIEIGSGNRNFDENGTSTNKYPHLPM